MRRLAGRCGLGVLALAALLLWGGLTAAQNKPAPAPTKNAKAKPAAAAPAGGKPAPKKEERLQIEWADHLVREGDLYHLRGNVVFAREDMKLYCDEADYDEKADTTKARGHLRITDPNSVITGDLLDADFGKQIAIVTGAVTIVTQKKGNKPSGHKPEPSLEKPGKGAKRGAPAASNKPGARGGTRVAAKPKSGRKEPEHYEDYWEKKSTITCERLEYFYADDAKRMIASPRVKAVQEDKTAWADTAVYEDLARLLTLTGHVVVNNEKGEELSCAKATIWVDEDRMEAQGITGIALRKSKKGEEPKNATPPAKTGESGAPAPPTPAGAPAPPAPAPKP